MNRNTTGKKILFLDQYSSVGGGQTVLIEMVFTATSAGYQVTVVAPMGGELEAKLRERVAGSVSYLHTPEPNLSAGKKSFFDLLRLARASFTLLRMLRTFKSADLIHVNGARWFPFFWLTKGIIGRPTIYHLHLDHGAKEKWLIRSLLSAPSTAAVICNSKFVEQRIREFGIRGNKLTLLRFGLTSAMSALPYTPPREHRQIKVAVIGRLSKEKGQELVAQISRTFPSIEFHFIGGTDFQDPSFENHLKQLSGTNVTFHGKSQDIVATVERLRINASIVPSRWEEPFGLVAVESMAMSLLTVVANRGGLKEIADETGCLIFETEEDLKRILSDLQSAPERFFARVEGEKKRTVSHFSYDKFRHDFLSLIDRTFANAGKKDAKSRT